MSLFIVPLLLTAGCVSSGLTAPPQAFLALGPVAAPEKQTPADGEAADTASPEALEEKLAQWRERFKDNSRKLRALSWNCRVKYKVPGAYTLHLLYRAAADENGDVQVWETTRRTEVVQGVTRAPDAPAPDDSGFEEAAIMAALARAYTFPQPGLMDRLLSLESASFVLGGGIAARQADFVMPGDSVEVTLPPAPKEPVSMTFQSADPTAPAQGKVKWRALPDGSFYPATVELTLPGSGIVTIVENFGFRMQPAIKATSPAP